MPPSSQDIAKELGIPPERLDSLLERASHEKYTNSFTYFGRVADDFNNTFPPIPEGTILDAGCSYGITTHELALRYPRCTILGIDQKAHRLPQVKVHPNVTFEQGDFFLLRRQFRPEQFTGIFLMNNLTYLAKELDLLQHTLLAESFNEVLAEGGFLCISGSGMRAVFEKRASAFHPHTVEGKFRKVNAVGSMQRAYGLAPEYQGT